MKVLAPGSRTTALACICTIKHYYFHHYWSAWNIAEQWLSLILFETLDRSSDFRGKVESSCESQELEVTSTRVRDIVSWLIEST